MNTWHIALAESAEEIRRCYPVMKELRPHFKEADRFVAQVQRQHAQGYRLAFLEAEKEVRAVAGYRYLESLFSGKNYLRGRSGHAGG